MAARLVDLARRWVEVLSHHTQRILKRGNKASSGGRAAPQAASRRVTENRLGLTGVKGSCAQFDLDSAVQGSVTQHEIEVNKGFCSQGPYSIK